MVLANPYWIGGNPQMLHTRKYALVNGNFRILKWRYCTIFLAIFCWDIPLHGHWFKQFLGMLIDTVLQTWGSLKGQFLYLRIDGFKLIGTNSNAKLTMNSTYHMPKKNKISHYIFGIYMAHSCWLYKFRFLWVKLPAGWCLWIKEQNMDLLWPFVLDHDWVRSFFDCINLDFGPWNFDLA